MSIAVADIRAAEEAADLESLEVALTEVTARLAAADKIGYDLRRRREALLQGAREQRRRHARCALDAFLPPLTFHSIEDAPEAVAGVVELFRGRRFYVSPSAWPDRPYRVRDRLLKSIVKDFADLASANLCARRMDEEHAFAETRITRRALLLALAAVCVVAAVIWRCL